MGKRSTNEQLTAHLKGAGPKFETFKLIEELVRGSKDLQQKKGHAVLAVKSEIDLLKDELEREKSVVRLKEVLEGLISSKVNVVRDGAFLTFKKEAFFIKFEVPNVII